MTGGGHPPKALEGPAAVVDAAMKQGLVTANADATHVVRQLLNTDVNALGEACKRLSLSSLTHVSV